ncbi:hypothetical protein N9J72_01405 [Candidatus Gracilibacteria bacterium]|nr:hypothetical protein [Candidatus Gracilibacteria bacterium]
MRDLPLVARMIVNLFLFAFYVLFFSLVFSFAFPLVLQAMGKPVMNPADPMFIKIQLFVAILVLLISIIWRKYFYLCGRESDKMIVLEEQIVTRKPRKKDLQDEEFKIFVDREVK